MEEKDNIIYNEVQQNLAKQIDSKVKLSNWKDWRWQLKHSIKDSDLTEKLTSITFSEKEKKNFKKIVKKFPISITPYYFSLINWSNYNNDPIYKQSFPMIQELNIEKHDMPDPLSEDSDSPVPSITHRYPDRILFHISNTCSMYCRHCTRKRKVGEVDYIPDKKTILGGIEYIKNTPYVRDVLLSGGDPLMLPDDYIDWILSELKKVKHIEIIRIGTRMPVVLPYRITDKLVKILQKYQPLWINTHFNHPREVTTSAKEALKKLADGGFPVGNQSVLLAGVNDCPRIIKKLVHKLLQNRVRPYYLYQCDLAEGLTHFRTPVSKGIEIMESLIGHTSGLAVPTYVIDAPGGGGKIPIMPQYLISWATNKVILRNYEGVITSYQEPDCYKTVFCDRNCAKCELPLNLDEANESKFIGIEKLLSYKDSTVSLIPEDNERYSRRDYLMGETRKFDKVELFENSIIQHGKYNNRIYLQKLSPYDVTNFLKKLDQLAVKNEYSKIFAKIPMKFKQNLMEHGYIEEAFIPKFFNEKEDASLMAKYLDQDRAKVSNYKELEAVLQTALEKQKKDHAKEYLAEGFKFKVATQEDIEQIVSVYGKVFATYPFPIFKPEYILKTMTQNVEYFCIIKDNKIVSLSSSEKGSYKEVEMTDFATLPEYRGHKFSLFLLSQMERRMRKQDFKTAYTIARAQSYGMNITFAKSGYKYSGTLVNNTNISGQLESMNVWYKSL